MPVWAIEKGSATKMVPFSPTSSRPARRRKTKPQSKWPTRSSAKASAPVKTTSTPLRPTTCSPRARAGSPPKRRRALTQYEPTSINAPPSRAGSNRVARMPRSWESEKPKAARTRRSRPIVPESTSSSSRAVCGWCRPMKPLREDQPSGLGGIERPLDLVGMPRERFLDEHVLARFKGAERPLAVQTVRKRDVHGLHVGICKQRFVAPIRTVDPVLPRVAPSTRLVPAGDRDHVHNLALRCPGEDRLVDQGRR